MMARARLTKNKENDLLEMFINGQFEAGWGMDDLPKEIKGKVENMLEVAFAAGQSARSAEIKKLIG
jgi:hypothetical protein